MRQRNMKLYILNTSGENVERRSSWSSLTNLAAGVLWMVVAKIRVEFSNFSIGFLLSWITVSISVSEIRRSPTYVNLREAMRAHNNSMKANMF